MAGIVQLAVATVFYLLYVVTPVSFTPDAPVRATPLGLSLFTIPVVLRLWFAATDQLSRRARRFLVQSVTQTQAASDLSQFFDREVAERITGADLRVAAGHGEMRHAALDLAVLG